MMKGEEYGFKMYLETHGAQDLSQFVERSTGDYFLSHNHITHEPRTRSGVNGFRAWLQRRETIGFAEACDCGWRADLGPHYRIKAEFQTADD